MYRSVVLLNKNIETSKFIDEMVHHVWEWLKIDDKTKENISKTLLAEINTFQKTLSNGLKVLEDIISKWSEKKVISWVDTFKLYDTFGFPLELTQEIAQEKWRAVDETWFEAELTKQQDRSRAATKDMFTKGIDRSAHIQWLPSTKFTGYSKLESTDSKLLKDFEVNDQRVLVFDTTPFYAEWGWQTGDRGVITLDGGEQVKVIDVKKYEGIYLHLVA